MFFCVYSISLFSSIIKHITTGIHAVIYNNMNYSNESQLNTPHKRLLLASRRRRADTTLYILLLLLVSSSQHHSICYVHYYHVQYQPSLMVRCYWAPLFLYFAERRTKQPFNFLLTKMNVSVYFTEARRTKNSSSLYSFIQYAHNCSTYYVLSWQ